jgi:ankyrin repeat protein
VQLVPPLPLLMPTPPPLLLFRRLTGRGDLPRSPEEGSSDLAQRQLSNLRDLCRSSLLTDDALRREFTCLVNQNGAVDLPYDMNIILFDVCANERVTLGIVRCVLEYLPGSVEARTSTGKTPLHVVCRNKNVTLDIVEFLVKEYPDALSLQDENGMSPLFYLCTNGALNESVAVEILDLLLERCPELAKQSCTDGYLPYQYAIRRQSPDFCCKLMAAFPEAIHHEYDSKPMLWYLLLLASPAVENRVAQAMLEMLVGNHPDLIRRFRRKGESPLHIVARAKISRSAELCGLLIEALPELVDTFTLPDEGGVGLLQPLHIACVEGNLPVVKCILDMYPNAIFGQTSLHGIFPIHVAAMALARDNFSQGAVGVINFLLTVDASVASQTYSEVNGLEMTPLRLACLNTDASNSSVGLQVIKLLHNARPEAIYTLGDLPVIAEVANFIDPQLHYARIARDLQLVTTPDEDGNLPIHLALYDDRATLGTIKLLLDANNSTLLTPTHNNGNTLLHEACRLGYYGLIDMLLTLYPTEQVHTQNLLGELPIQVLIESGVDEPESAEHLSSIFLLLRASPAALMNGTDHGSE